VLPHLGQIPGGDDGVRRQPVHLGLVQQQEEGGVATHAVVRVVAVEAGVGDSGLVQLVDAQGGPLARFVQRAELDGPFPSRT